MVTSNESVLVSTQELDDSPEYFLIKNADIITWFTQEVEFGDASSTKQDIPGTGVSAYITIGSTWNDKVLAATTYAGGRIPGVRELDDTEFHEMVANSPDISVLEAEVY